MLNLSRFAVQVVFISFIEGEITEEVVADTNILLNLLVGWKELKFLTLAFILKRANISY